MTSLLEPTVGADLEPLQQLVLQHEIEQFLYREALLLDERRFEEWLDLFTEDTHYFMPTRAVRYERDIERELSGPDDVAHFDETKEQLGQRITRIRSGMAWAEDPPSRTRHLITNVMVSDGADAGEYVVQSNFLTFRGRLDVDTDWFPGSRTDVLRRDPSAEYGWLIASRRIVLDHTVILSKNISIFL